MIEVRFIIIRNNRWKAKLSNKKKNVFVPLHYLTSLLAIFSSVCLTWMFYDCTGGFIAQKFCKDLKSTQMKWVSFKDIEYETPWKINYSLLIYLFIYPAYILFTSDVFLLYHRLISVSSSISFCKVEYSHLCEREHDMNFKFFPLPPLE